MNSNIGSRIHHACTQPLAIRLHSKGERKAWARWIAEEVKDEQKRGGEEGREGVRGGKRGVGQVREEVKDEVKKVKRWAGGRASRAAQTISVLPCGALQG